MLLVDFYNLISNKSVFPPFAQSSKLQCSYLTSFSGFTILLHPIRQHKKSHLDTAASLGLMKLKTNVQKECLCVTAKAPLNKKNRLFIAPFQQTITRTCLLAHNSWTHQWAWVHLIGTNCSGNVVFPLPKNLIQGLLQMVASHIPSSVVHCTNGQVEGSQGNVDITSCRTTLQQCGFQTTLSPNLVYFNRVQQIAKDSTSSYIQRPKMGSGEQLHLVPKMGTDWTPINPSLLC